VVLTDTDHYVWPMLQLECHSEAYVDLDALVRRREGEDCQAVVPVQAVFERACRAGRESGSTLVREKPNPVGSARFRDLPKTGEESWAGLVPLPLLSIKRAVWHTPLGPCWGGSHPACSAEAATGNKLEPHPSWQENPLTCTSVTPIFYHLSNGRPK
jgi:hypothetical protein